MANNEAQFNVLLNKYNRLLAQFNDLKQTSDEKEEKWRELQKSYMQTESSIRSLCEVILAKDKNEMVLGKEYSWSKVEIRALIQKAMLSYKEYNNNRVALMKQMQSELENRRNMIESLQFQITNNDGKPVVNNSENETPASDTKKPDDSQNLIPYKDRQAAQSGGIITEILENENDYDATDEALEQEMHSLNKAIRMNKADIGVVQTKTHSKKTQKEQNEAVNFVMIGVEKAMKEMTPRMKYVVQALGETGYMETRAIASAAAKRAKADDPKLTEQAFVNDLKNKRISSLVLSECIANPLKGKYTVYKLNDIGKAVYKNTFGKDPVVSEFDQCIKDHDNLHHAIGIRELQGILVSSKYFSSVSMKRDDNVIRVNGSTTYIPDIIAKKQGKVFYFEYDLGNHTQTDWNAKMNKACLVGKELFIVTDNRDTQNMKLVTKINSWIESRKDDFKIKKQIIRLTTLASLNGVKDIYDDKYWNVIWDLSKSNVPTVM